ncbi:MAG: leucine-rich repeat domain-containing protein [Candidatus Methanoplasma sp.]|jgi:hypothetical protein|nr:leucine-rich repeat domain-containing protein [Candidatus Methanoplasma sp.]
MKDIDRHGECRQEMFSQRGDFNQPKRKRQIGQKGGGGTASLRNLTVLLTAVFITAGFFALCAESNASDADGGSKTYNFESDSLRYTINDDNSTVTVVGYKGTLTDVSIPAAVANGSTYNVTAVGDKAFFVAGSPNKTIRSVEIGENVTSIGSYAFGQLYIATSVTIPSGVISIGDHAFYDCDKLESVIIPNSVETIGEYAFAYCDVLSDVTLSSSLESIPEAAFQQTALTSIDIPDGVTSIGHSAFAFCPIGSAVLPEGLTEIGEAAFVSAKFTEIDIPETVKSIDINAFQDCTNLETVTIPGSVERIGEGAFGGCTALESAVISEGVAGLGRSMFYGCTDLSSVALPSSLTSIDAYAFGGCAIESIELPESITSLGSNAFNGCPLEYVTLPSGLTSIAQGLFYNCADLKSIEIPSGVDSIGVSAFNGCASLESVTIPNSVESIGARAFRGCAIESIVIPDSVKSLGDQAFENCTSLESIVIPDGTITGGTGQFGGCENISAVIVSGGLTGTDPATGGVIDACFKAGTEWKLPGQTGTTVESLTLKDISSQEYGPEKIAGASGRTLRYSDAYYVSDGSDEWILQQRSVSGSIDNGGSVINSPQMVNYGNSSQEMIFTAAGGYYIVSCTVNDSPVNINGSPVNTDYGVRSWTYTAENVTSDVTITVATAPLPSHNYKITFSSGLGYTVYVNGSQVSSPVDAGSDGIFFTVIAKEGYRATPSVMGIALLSTATDDEYRVYDLNSNVTISVLAVPYQQENVQEGNGNDPENESGESDSPSVLWAAGLIAAAALAIVAVCSLFFFRHGKK